MWIAPLRAQSSTQILGQPTIILLQESSIGGGPGNTSTVFHAGVSCDTTQAARGITCTGIPVGQVMFFVNGAAWQTDTLDATGNAAIPASATWLPGKQIVTAQYLGAAAYASSSSSSVTYQVSGIVTHTNVAVAAGQGAVGSSTTVSGNVSCNSACGNVQLLADGAGWLTMPVDASGNFVANTATMPSGSHLITAQYIGDALHYPSVSAPVVYDVAPRTPTDISLNSSGSAGPLGISSTSFSGSVDCYSACGSVSLLIDGQPWQTIALDGDGAFSTMNAAAWLPGSHVIGATFMGNSLYEPSFADPVPYSVIGTPTVTTLIASGNGLPNNASASFQAHVDCNTSCGSVAFLLDGGEWGTQPLDANGNALVWNNTAWAPGQHTISVNYPGDSTHNPSQSSPAPYAVAGNNYGSPEIFNVSPNSSAPSTAAAPQIVTITGTNFDNFYSRVMFGRLCAVVIDWSPTTVHVQVPPGAMSGPLTLETGSNVIAQTSFQVTR